MHNRYLAKPRSERDCKDKLGTEGVIAGHYKNVENFERYALRSFGDPAVTYSVYMAGWPMVLIGVWQNGSWRV